MTGHSFYRGIVAAAVAAFGTMLGAPPALSQAQWPTSRITLVVPFTPGGSTDILARLISQKLEAALGQTVVVENRAGAGGSTASAEVARSNPDGYTIAMGHIGTLSVNPNLYTKLGYDPLKSFEPVTMIARVHNVLVVNPELPVKSTKELIDYAKANPGKVGYGSSGIGQTFHLAGEMLKLRTGGDFVHVPYKGTAQALQDFFAGRLLMMFYPPNNVMLDRIRKGEIRPVAAMSDKRLANLPDVPTFEELGVGNLGVSGWGGFSGPAKLPRPIVTRINQAVNKVIARPEVIKALDTMTMVPLRTTPEEMTEKVRREIAFWTEMVTRLGIKPGG